MKKDIKTNIEALDEVEGTVNILASQVLRLHCSKYTHLFEIINSNMGGNLTVHQQKSLNQYLRARKLLEHYIRLYKEGSAPRWARPLPPSKVFEREKAKKLSMFKESLLQVSKAWRETLAENCK